MGIWTLPSVGVSESRGAHCRNAIPFSALLFEPQRVCLANMIFYWIFVAEKKEFIP
tara:strand:- start:2949 stop:3116 length:168 start_codon:yes stop_codon:yes gene_type:complete